MIVRAIRIDGDVAYVPLTKGYEAVVDVADVPLVHGVNWCAGVKRGTVYAMRTKYGPDGRETVMMHRAICLPAVGVEVDHKDGNGLNNTRANLRSATKSQNMHNQKISTRNTSGFKGVSKIKGRWESNIRLNGKKRRLGIFDTPEAASAAYAKASAALHGEFGRVA